MDNNNFNEICHKILADGVVITLIKKETENGEKVYNYRVVCYNKIWVLTQIEKTFVYMNVERV